MPKKDGVDPFTQLGECKRDLVKASADEKADIYVRMGDAYIELKKVNKALICYQEALDAGKEDIDFIQKYAQYLSDSGKSTEAIDLIQIILDRTEEPLSKAKLHARGSVISRLIGNFDNGVDMGKKALKILNKLDGEKPEVKTIRAEANTSIALNLWRRGKIEEADRYLETALEIYKEIDDKKGLSDIYNHLGIVNSLMGRQQKALDCYEKSKEIMDKARCYINIGIVKQLLGEFDEAEDNFKMALKKGRDESYKIAVHLAQLNLADLNIDEGNVPMAKTWIDLAYRGYKEMKGNPRISIVMETMARILLLKGEIDEANKVADEALLVAKTHNIEDAMARTYHTFGLIYKEKNDLERSKECLDMAIKLMKEINLIRYIGRCYITLAEVNRELGLEDETKTAAENAREVLEMQDAKFLLGRLEKLGF